jgi:pilus assembly protein CpaE
MLIQEKLRVKIAFKSLNFNKKMVQIVNSCDGFEALEASDTGYVHLLVIELGPSPEKDLDLLKSMTISGEVGEVFLTSDYADPGILMQAMRLGVKEFIPQPFDESDVRQALERFKDRCQRSKPQPAAKQGKILSIFGSKGGVGTTTVAVNLAVALKKAKDLRSIALLDMNTLFGEIPLFLEIAPKFHWGEITKNIERLDETFLSNILTTHRSGIQVLPSPAYLNGHVRPTPEIMVRLLAVMQRMFDFVIIDAGQSTNDTSLKVMEITNYLLLVTILSLPCLANTNKLLKSLTDLGYVSAERIKLVLNRYVKNSEISLKDAEAGLGRGLFCSIPNDYTASMAAINNGKPILEIAPKSEIARSFLEMAECLAEVPADKTGKKKSLFFGK